MNKHRYTPERIVYEKLTFSIPLYQRLFTWEDSQVEGLLYDLKRHFENNGEESPYYIGMLSCIANNGYDLIDGQQRLTVTTLMGIVLKKYAKEWNDFLKDGERLNFTARSHDKEYLRRKITGEKTEIINEKMENGIRCISNFMERSGNFSSDDERENYARNVYKNLSFFFSELPTYYASHPSSLNKYFEAMNISGKGLEQHEILKVELLKGQNNQEHLTRIWNLVADMSRPIIRKSQDETEEEYLKKYETAINSCRNKAFDAVVDSNKKQLDNEDNTEIGAIEPERHTFNHDNNDDSDRALISFPELLMMVYDIYYNLNGSYSFYREELLNVYKEHKIDDIPDFYHQLLFYRLLLDYYIIHKEGEGTVNKYTLTFGEGTARKQVEQYQSMLYVAQTPFYNWIKPILIKLHNERVDSSETLLKWLKDIDDNKLHKELKALDDMTYDKGIDRYWFWRLDYYLWERREEYFPDKADQEIVSTYTFHTNRSIEHLHPQHQTNNTEWSEADIHSFGNLAMISQSFNSEQSDDPVQVKFARIAEQASTHSLQSLKLFLMYLDAKKNPEGWTQEVKNQHQEEMYTLLVDSKRAQKDL